MATVGLHGASMYPREKKQNLFIMCDKIVSLLTSFFYIKLYTKQFEIVYSISYNYDIVYKSI